MSNRTVPAAAEGLPAITRRLFLSRLGATSAAVAVATTTAVAAHVAEPAENPALLALEPELAAAEAEMIAAADEYREALRVGTALWPRAPEAITYKCASYDCSIERDITGAGYKDALGVNKTEYLRWQVQRVKRWRKITPERKEERDRTYEVFAEAEAYEKACAHAKSVSQYDKAQGRRGAAGEALKAVVHRIQAEEATTIAGVRIKARAFRGWEEAPNCMRVFHPHSAEWAASFARSVLGTMEG